MSNNKTNKRIPILEDRLRELQGDLSNVEFAEKLGLSRQAVGFYINGDRVPDARIVLQICERCGVSADYLLGQTAVRDYDIEAKAVEKYTGLSGDTIRLLHTWVEVENVLKKHTLDELEDFMDEFDSMSDGENVIWDCILAMDSCELNAGVFFAFLDIIIKTVISRSKDLLSNYKRIIIAYQQMRTKKGLFQSGENLIGDENFQKLQRNGFQIVDAELAYNHAWNKLLSIIKKEILDSIALDMEKNKLPWKIEMAPENNDEMCRIIVEAIGKIAEEVREKNIEILTE